MTRKQLKELVARGDKLWRKKLASLAEQRKPYTERIPSFWATSMMMHEDLQLCLTAPDLGVLDYLTDLSVHYLHDLRSDFRVVWTFQPNPYFSNSSVWVTLRMSEGEFEKLENPVFGTDDPEEACPEYVSEACEIHWKTPDTLKSLQEPLEVVEPITDEPDGDSDEDGPARERGSGTPKTASLDWSMFHIFMPATSALRRQIKFRILCALAWDLFEDPVKYYQNVCCTSRCCRAVFPGHPLDPTASPLGLPGPILTKVAGFPHRLSFPALDPDSTEKSLSGGMPMHW